MQTLTYNLLVHLNAALFEEELYFKVECHDEIYATTYGMGACACDGKQERAREFIKDYLEKEGCQIQFIGGSLDFRVGGEKGNEDKLEYPSSDAETMSIYLAREKSLHDQANMVNTAE